mmetsp:Transcript_116403/g.361685  ORF Transcript_116403/g.361685 Transcript_116403/m.361685 type:complete len:230 (+) Transcript_116403:25-714(+)
MALAPRALPRCRCSHAARWPRAGHPRMVPCLGLARLLLGLEVPGMRLLGRREVAEAPEPAAHAHARRVPARSRVMGHALRQGAGGSDGRANRCLTRLRRGHRCRGGRRRRDTRGPHEGVVLLEAPAVDQECPAIGSPSQLQQSAPRAGESLLALGPRNQGTIEKGLLALAPKVHNPHLVHGSGARGEKTPVGLSRGLGIGLHGRPIDKERPGVATLLQLEQRATRSRKG